MAELPTTPGTPASAAVGAGVPQTWCQSNEPLPKVWWLGGVARPPVSLVITAGSVLKTQTTRTPKSTSCRETIKNFAATRTGPCSSSDDRRRHASVQCEAIEARSDCSGARRAQGTPPTDGVQRGTLHQVMLCWDADPKQRPCFDALVTILQGQSQALTQLADAGCVSPDVLAVAPSAATAAASAGAGGWRCSGGRPSKRRVLGAWGARTKHLGAAAGARRTRVRARAACCQCSCLTKMGTNGLAGLPPHQHRRYQLHRQRQPRY